MTNLVKHAKKWQFWTIIFMVSSIMFMLGRLQGFNNSTTELKHELSKLQMTVEEDIENFARQNSRYILDGIGQCIIQDLEDKGDYGVKSYRSSIYKCGGGHRSCGITGDQFAFNPITGRMEVDASKDCLKGGELRPFNPEFERRQAENDFKYEKGECWMHQDKKMCIEAIKKLYHIGTTNEHSKISWNFDGELEYLESKVLKTTTMGFMGPVGDGFDNKNNLQLQIVVGAQRDEIMKNFESTIENINILNTKYINVIQKIDNYLIAFTVLLVIMLTITTVTIKEK